VLKDAKEIGVAQRNASLSRQKTRARDMHENSAAAISDPRPDIVVKHDDDIVETVVAVQVFGAGRIGQSDPTIIVAILRCIAPAIKLCDDLSLAGGFERHCKKP
jgi:hypothetical protein